MITLNSKSRTVNRLAEKSLSVVMVNGRMVFPDILGSVSVVLDVPPGEDARWLQYALSVISRQNGKASDGLFVDAVLPNGVCLSLNSTHGERAHVLFVADTLVFMPSQVGLCEGLKVGDEVRVVLCLPETHVDIHRWTEGTVHWVSGLRTVTMTSKGRKKTCANAEFSLFSEPSGERVLYFYDFIEGHSRADYWRNHGYVVPVPGDTMLRGVVKEWSGFTAYFRFVFPPKQLELNLTIIDIQRT